MECVTPRFYSKSIGCCKRFPGRNAITGFNTLKHWIKELVTEIVERLEKDVEENNRQPKHSVISFTLEINGEDIAQTRSIPITSIEQEYLEQVMMDVLKKHIDPFFKKNEAAGLLNYPIKYLGISTGKFITIEKKTVTLEKMFAKQALKAPPATQSFAPGGSSTQVLGENKKPEEKNKPENNENSLGKMFEKQSQMFKEKPKEENQPKAKTSFFQSFFTKSKNEEDIPKVESVSNAEETVAENVKSITEHNEDEDPKEKMDIKALEDWFINSEDLKNDSDPRPPDPPIYRNETERKALEKLYEIQSNIGENESFDLEKEKDTLKRLMDIKTKETVPSPKATNDIILSKNENLTVEPPLIENNEQELPREQTKYSDPYVKCEQCGKNVVANDKAVQSHKDYHTALNVSREQREEFRQEVKKKILSPKGNPAKKAKLDSTISKFKTFFEQKDPSEQSTVDQQPCEECGRLIDVDKLAEHADYHFARKIQIEMNSNDIKMVSKTKKPQATKAKGKDAKSGPNLMTFFSQPSTSKTSIN